MMEKETYANGQKVYELQDGKLTYFFKDGKVKSKGPFEKDQMEGEWTFYRATGQLWQVGNFKMASNTGAGSGTIRKTSWSTTKYLKREKSKNRLKGRTMDTYTLSNGVKMPVLGYGMWRNKNPKEAVQGVIDAISVGFRHIDGAAAYQNEELVGQGIKESGIAREELFLTSKLKNDAHGDDWQTDNLETWQAFEELYDEGVLKAIGVSNFSVEHLENLVNHARIKPMVNQLLVHPGVLQTETRDYCTKHGILIQAYSPLKPLSVLKEEARVQKMLEKYDKSIAQLLLRFDLQVGVVPLTKSVHRERIEENFDIFDFEIDDEDMQYLKEWSHPEFTEPDNKNERPPQVS
ncbi:aldo/keto reductase [Atopococcus tabaci]|uniref:aldo/keto reductase n=1 Tax=Atopococcus tabaci TaxID=269774 RepID=UPI002409E504|nr:aldo/keto reductase [Atopococcus tabaci]